jgi:hypothetical protein
VTRVTFQRTWRVGGTPANGPPGPNIVLAHKFTAVRFNGAQRSAFVLTAMIMIRMPVLLRALTKHEGGSQRCARPFILSSYLHI